MTSPPPTPGRAREEQRRGERVCAPALASTWTPASRWRMRYVGRRAKRAHTNIQETRAAAGLLRHLTRATQVRNRRILALIDSMVALGALSKGRTSAAPLLRLRRQGAVPVPERSAGAGGKGSGSSLEFTTTENRSPPVHSSVQCQFTDPSKTYQTHFSVAFSPLQIAHAPPPVKL